MARQAGPFFFVGEIDGLIFYKQGDEYFVRKKSKPTSTTRKRLKDKNYYPVLNIRKNEFGQASQLAKEVYYQLPKAMRGHGKQQKRTGRVVRMMRKGMTAEEISASLLQELVGTKPAAEQPAPTKAAESSVPKKEALPPAGAMPKKLPTAQPAKNFQLSDWQIGDNGRWIKEPVKQQVVTGNSIEQPLVIKTKCCPPCVFQGLVPRLGSAGSG